MVSPSEPVVFQQTVETLLRALGEKLDYACAQRLRLLGVDPEQPLTAAYPLAVWVAVLRVAGEALCPGASELEATYLVGTRFVRSYDQTLLGKATVALARVLGPRRTLQRMTNNIRTGNNYTECLLDERGPTHFHMKCRPVTVVGFYMGIIEEGLRVAGAVDPRVTLLRRDGLETDFDITWREAAGSSAQSGRGPT